MTATLHFPKYRLAAVLKRPGGITVGKALRDAQKGLDSLAAPCRDEVDRLLTQLDAAWCELREGEDISAVKTMYARTREMIGICHVAGFQAMDEVAFSLCELLDRLPPREVAASEGVIVHMRSLHLLRRGDVIRNEATVAKVLDGLAQVNKRLSAPTLEAEDGG